jgi:hypothetical protein
MLPTLDEYGAAGEAKDGGALSVPPPTERGGQHPRSASGLGVRSHDVHGRCSYAQEVRSDVSTAAGLASSPAQGKKSVAADGVEGNATESADWQLRIAAARQRHDGWLACVAARRSKCSQTPTPDPMEALLNDETLVNGDIVSTPKGLRVFRGQHNLPHYWADFK